MICLARHLREDRNEIYRDIPGRNACIGCIFMQDKADRADQKRKEYGSLNLQDKTGTVDAKIWELNSPGINEFSAMDYVFVDADVTVFQGQFQLNVKRIRRADENEYRPSDYLPVTAKDVKTMHHELVQYITTIRNENLRKLAAGFFMNDAAFIKEFCAHSAAKSVHHSFVGGLLEHTLSVVKMCDYFCKQYPALNRDLLLTAAMFHDIGKTKELSSFPENDYTDEGQLVGHIIIGAQMVTEQIGRFRDSRKSWRTN